MVLANLITEKVFYEALGISKDLLLISEDIVGLKDCILELSLANLISDEVPTKSWEKVLGVSKDSIFELNLPNLISDKLPTKHWVYISWE